MNGSMLREVHAPLTDESSRLSAWIDHWGDDIQPGPDGGRRSRVHIPEIEDFLLP
jgi:hypothetical protein